MNGSDSDQDDETDNVVTGHIETQLSFQSSTSASGGLALPRRRCLVNRPSAVILNRRIGGSRAGRMHSTVVDVLVSDNGNCSTTEENDSGDDDDDMMEVPYAQNLGIPGETQRMILAELESTCKEPLRAGDVIAYHHPLVVAGSHGSLRVTIVLSIDTAERSFPLQLANGECLPIDTIIRRVQEYRKGRWYHHPGISRPIECFILSTQKWTGPKIFEDNQLQRVIQKARDALATLPRDSEAQHLSKMNVDKDLSEGSESTGSSNNILYANLAKLERLAKARSKDVSVAPTSGRRKTHLERKITRNSMNRNFDSSTDSCIHRKKPAVKKSDSLWMDSDSSSDHRQVTSNPKRSHHQTERPLESYDDLSDSRAPDERREKSKKRSTFRRPLLKYKAMNMTATRNNNQGDSESEALYPMVPKLTNTRYPTKRARNRRSSPCFDSALLELASPPKRANTTGKSGSTASFKTLRCSSDDSFIARSSPLTERSSPVIPHHSFTAKLKLSKRTPSSTWKTRSRHSIDRSSLSGVETFSTSTLKVNCQTATSPIDEVSASWLASSPMKDSSPNIRLSSNRVLPLERAKTCLTVVDENQINRRKANEVVREDDLSVELRKCALTRRFVLAGPTARVETSRVARCGDLAVDLSISLSSVNHSSDAFEDSRESSSDTKRNTGDGRNKWERRIASPTRSRVRSSSIQAKTPEDLDRKKSRNTNLSFGKFEENGNSRLTGSTVFADSLVAQIQVNRQLSLTKQLKAAVKTTKGSRTQHCTTRLSHMSELTDSSASDATTQRNPCSVRLKRISRPSIRSKCSSGHTKSPDRVKGKRDVRHENGTDLMLSSDDELMDDRRKVQVKRIMSKYGVKQTSPRNFSSKQKRTPTLSKKKKPSGTLKGNDESSERVSVFHQTRLECESYEELGCSNSSEDVESLPSWVRPRADRHRPTLSISSSFTGSQGSKAATALTSIRRFPVNRVGSSQHIRYNCTPQKLGQNGMQLTLRPVPRTNDF